VDPEGRLGLELVLLVVHLFLVQSHPPAAVMPGTMGQGLKVRAVRVVLAAEEHGGLAVIMLRVLLPHQGKAMQVETEKTETVWGLAALAAALGRLGLIGSLETSV
jgi:hypothetical protein